MFDLNFHSFIEIVNKSKRKPNNLWVDQGRDFYNKLMQKCLQDNYILMHSFYDDGRPVNAETYIRASKGKIIKKWQIVIVSCILIIWIS